MSIFTSRPSKSEIADALLEEYRLSMQKQQSTVGLASYGKALTSYTPRLAGKSSAAKLYQQLKEEQENKKTMAKKAKSQLKKGDKVKIKPIGSDDMYDNGYDMSDIEGEIDFATVYEIEDVDADDDTLYVNNLWFKAEELELQSEGVASAVTKGVQKIGNSYVDVKYYNIIKTCVELNESVLLIGETGTGKTTIIREVAKEKGKNLIRVSLNGSTGIEEILGKYLAKDSSTYWQDGILTTAMKNGDWIVFDEINSALPEILFALHSLLDDEKKVMLVEKDNEIITPHPEFRFFGTMNPSEDYAGTKDMNKALLSRFNAIIHVETLLPQQEEEVIVSESGVDSKNASILVRLGNELRALKKQEKLFYYASTRDFVQVGRLVKAGIPMADAVEVAVVNKMSKDEASLPDTVRTLGTYVKMDVKTVISFKDVETELAKMKAEVGSLKVQLSESENEKEKFKTEFIEKMKTLLVKN